MSDYISREAAKTACCDICNDEYVCFRDKQSCGAIKVFDAIPAADVKPVVRGKWRKISECLLQCSVCGDTWSMPTEGMGAFRYRMRYCPECGSYMREEAQCEEK